MKRRDFIKLLGATTGTALVASCGVQKGTEKLIPHVIPPEDGLAPGQPAFYNSTCTECPANCGLTVKVHEKLTANNRYERYPVKLEGLSGHPINDGTLCIRGQSSLTRLYHPERLKEPLIRDGSGKLKVSTWKEAYLKILDALEDSDDEGLTNVYLSGRTTGSLSELIDTFTLEMDIERLLEFEVYSYAALREANGILYAINEIPSHDIENADFLLTLGADILETYISPVNNSNQFSRAKRQNDFKWFHVEPHHSLTGMSANERFVLNPGSEVYLLLFLLNYIKEKGLIKEMISQELLDLIPILPVEEISRKTGITPDGLNKLAQPFDKAKSPLVLTGGISARQGSGLDALVLTGLIQWATGAKSSLIDFSKGENYSNVGTMLDIEELSEDLQDEDIGVIFISRTDPVSSLPPSFKNDLMKAQLRVGMSELHNKTMEVCDVILPLSHSLESWGDAEPRYNIKTIIQPVLKPLHNTLAEGDILLQLMELSAEDETLPSYQEYVLNEWKKSYGESFIEEVLNKGYLEETPDKDKVKLQERSLKNHLKSLKLPEVMKKPVLLVTPSIRSFDGRSADLPLLSEIPDPVTTISYGKWVSISEKTARKDKLRDGDELQISSSKMSVKLPVKIQEGLAEGVYTVHQGMVDSILIQTDRRSGEIISYLDGVKISKTGRSERLPILSGSIAHEGKGVIPYPAHAKHAISSMYAKHEHKDYRWAMAIDLDLCTGCSSCVAACYIENNIPIVGKKEHLIGREMSWIRIEQHKDAHEKINMVPMLCQHCDYAPCEPVCPVFAAYHNPEGLNAQIYNRCVGTRYCANNCPYKVRRFNWFDQDWPEPLDKMQNPAVSVRTKGIMEKCTFCVQRIRVAKDLAKDDSRKVRDGEVVPACAQTCPTEAIVFGNILDRKSRVYELSHSKRSTRIFEDLGVEPAVHYLPKKA
ncbi:MAG: molybdopterin-dependent oxidoreductase [Thermoplasmata archaeon]